MWKERKRRNDQFFVFFKQHLTDSIRTISLFFPPISLIFLEQKGVREKSVEKSKNEKMEWFFNLGWGNSHQWECNGKIGEETQFYKCISLNHSKETDCHDSGLFKHFSSQNVLISINFQSDNINSIFLVSLSIQL